MEFFKPRSTIDFMKHRGLLITISLGLTLLGLLSGFFPGPNYGIDFRGGTEVQLKFNGKVDAGTVRKVLADEGFDPEVVNVAGSSDQYLVRVGRVAALSAEKIDAIKKQIA